ncbi:MULTISPECIES: glycosyltransferase [Marinobacter]|uniref:glycosyltransferase n=1 Tax=Marinobacter TaxID=2742 RepID=UPI0013A69996|nr:MULTISPECIES: glycosyltransferase [Marinobacter]
MIFLTVGTQLAFDRLVRSLDEWIGPDHTYPAFAQIGRGEYLPRHISYERYLEPESYQKYLDAAQVVVGHCGIGTILSCNDRGIPVVVVPRRYDLNEHRNDHQIATARQVEARGLAQVVYDERELGGILRQVLEGNETPRAEHAERERLAQNLNRVVNRVLGTAGELP